MALEKNELHELLRRTQSEKDKLEEACLRARARLYDLLHPEQYNTPNMELKAEIQRLETQLGTVRKFADQQVFDKNRLSAENKKLRALISAEVR